jgi:DNA polymerase-3 subunit delta
LISLPRLDAATRKGAWFGALENFGVSVQIDPIERNALPQWIAQVHSFKFVRGKF